MMARGNTYPGKMKHTRNEEIKELMAMSDKELIQHKKEMRLAVLQTSPGLVDPKLNPGNRGQVRKRIARINTILGQRRLRGVAKEEKKLSGK